MKINRFGYNSTQDNLCHFSDVEQAIKESIEKVKKRTEYVEGFTLRYVVNFKDVIEILEGILK